MIYIYVLKLTDNKFYVGRSINPKSRIACHFKGQGSAWSKKYPPLEILEIIPNCIEEDEDKYVIKYMKDYGIANVRGGSFVLVKLTEEDIKFLNRMICGNRNVCFRCNSSDHFIDKCPMSAKRISNKNKIDHAIQEESSQEETIEKETIQEEKIQGETIKKDVIKEEVIIMESSSEDDGPFDITDFIGDLMNGMSSFIDEHFGSKPKKARKTVIKAETFCLRSGSIVSLNIPNWCASCIVTSSNNLR